MNSRRRGRALTRPESEPCELPWSQRALDLKQKICAKQVQLAVVGLGYVGLPLCGALHKAGYRLLGFDLDPQKIASLQAGKPYLKHLGQDLYTTLRDSDRFTASGDEADLQQADVVIVCVPTPLGRHREPDLGFVQKSIEMLARHQRKGRLVILESTTYPGTTRELCQPILESAGEVCGKDFFLAFSPEREDPGREDFDTCSTPKLVGGVDPISGELASLLFEAAIERVIHVESSEIAEAAKLLENIYRSVNIALVNELKPVFSDMGIDIWKVIEAASSKPFGYQAFYPGPGMGGHCIPIDPFYLSWRAREFGHSTKFIELAGEINTAMPGYVIDRVIEGLNARGKTVLDARILICGVAYKPNVDDTRETPAARIITELQQAGAQVTYHDPHVASFPRKRAYDIRMDSQPINAELLADCDCVLILIKHSKVDYRLLADQAGLIVDACNAMADFLPIQGDLIKA